MKRIISFALIVAMCATIMLVPTVANATVNSNFSWDNGTGYGGLFGKTADEYSKKITTSGDKFNCAVRATKEYDFTDKKYAVLDLNVAPNENATYISVGPDGGLFTINSNKFIVNRWNQVRIVVEDKSKEELGTNSQVYTLYINGVKIGSKAHGNAVQYANGFRFNVRGPQDTHVGYVADMVLTDSDEDTAPVMPEIKAGEKFAVNADKTITFAPDAGVTAKDIKDANPDADIRVFFGERFVSQLSDDTVVSKGNIVVIKENNIYNYYTVNTLSPNNTKLAETTNGTLPSNLGKNNVTLTQNVEGLGGKAASDKIIKITSKSVDSFIQYIWGSSAIQTAKPSNVLDYNWNKKMGTYKGYLVLEYSVYNVDCPVLQVKTDKGQTIVPDFGSYVPKNKWSRVRIVLDRTALTGNTTYYDVYVDGKFAVSGSSTGLGNHYSTDNKYRAANSIRIGVTSNDANIECTAYIDDITIYETTGPVSTESISIDDNTYYDVVGDELYYCYGADKEDIIESVNYGANNEKFSLFDSNGNVAADSQSASVLGVYGKSETAIAYGYTYNDMYRYYTLKEAPEKYDVVTSTPDLTNNKGTSVAVTDEVYGRTSSELKKVSIGEGNNYHNISWKTPKAASQYVVYSVDVAPGSGITHMYLGTDAHSRLSIDATVGQYFKANEWSNIKFVYDIVNNTVDLHIDGICRYANYPSSYVKGKNTCLRFIIVGNDGSEIYIDNLRVYEYTTIENPISYDKILIYSENDYDTLNDNWHKCTASSTTGPDGGDDTAVLLKSDNSDGGDMYVEYSWNKNIYGMAKYVIYEADVKLGTNVKSFKFGANQHEAICNEIKSTNPRIKSGWNKITIVSEADNGSNKVYINGIYDHSIESKVKRNPYDTKYNVMRFIGYMIDNKDTESEVLSLDNLMVYRTNDEPVYNEPVTGTYSAQTGATYTANCDYGTLVVAAFNGEEMMDVQYINITSGEKSITLKAEGATEYMAFILNNIDDISPMDDALVLSAQQTE